MPKKCCDDCPPGDDPCSGSQWQPLRDDAPPWFATTGYQMSPEDMITASIQGPQRPGSRGGPKIVRSGGHRAGSVRWATSRGTGAPSLRRAADYGVATGLGSIGEYAGQDCLAVRNDKGQSALEPCKLFCGSGDMESWRRLVEILIRDARLGCQRIAKCHRVELLVNKYEKEGGIWEQVTGLVTHERLIEDTLKPVAQELSCIVTAVKAAGQHPDDPSPLPTPPATGPEPEGAGWGMWLALVGGILVLGALGAKEYRERA